MKYVPANPYYRAALVLFATALVLVVTAVATNYHDLTSAALVISALICILTGIFIATLSGGDPLDIRYVGLLPVQGCISLCRISAELGIQGSAYIIPAGTGGRTATMQFLPVSTYNGSSLPANTFVTGEGHAGLLTVPSGYPLLREIRDREQLVIPGGIDTLPDLIREVGVDILEIADRVTVSVSGDTVTIAVEGYRLTGGCRVMSAESPRCCIMHPCPVSSLFACLIAESTGQVVQLERCEQFLKDGSVVAVFSLLPAN
jgi:hypothetical protein